MVLAAADIGSNTVHLLVGRVDAVSVERVVNDSEWLGLGEIVASKGFIPGVTQKSLIATLSRFRDLAVQFKAKRAYFFATEAVRRAENHNELLTVIRKDLGIDLDMISGRREAELALRGALLDTPGTSGALFDIGGGSAQVARFSDARVIEEASLPIGSGALRAAHHLADPPTPKQLKQLTEAVSKVVQSGVDFRRVRRGIASGGVARGVLRALHPDGERQVDYYEIEYLIESLSYLTIETASARFRVGPKRAASLLPGAIVLLTLLRQFDLDCITVSEGSIREGALMELAADRIRGCAL
jgi:exopolyphosphatase/guanosine-5'-triphosphate,3'-diphosphate pyrophosphatase